MIEVFETLESTQEEMKRWMERVPPPAHLDAIRAKVQTEGRGRRGNNWVSEQGNLFASVYLQTFSLPLTWVPHWVAWALREALTRSSGAKNDIPRIQLKWPNDLVFEDGSKIAGILCEKVGPGVIAGIGLNIKSAPQNLDRRVGAIQGLEPHHVLIELIEELRKEPERGILAAAFQSAAFLGPGETVTWTDAQGRARMGFVKGLGAYGELQVELDGGECVSLLSEEVSKLGRKA